jgi:hypothetical protein
VQTGDWDDGSVLQSHEVDDFWPHLTTIESSPKIEGPFFEARATAFLEPA